MSPTIKISYELWLELVGNASAVCGYMECGLNEGGRELARRLRASIGKLRDEGLGVKPPAPPPATQPCGEEYRK